MKRREVIQAAISSIALTGCSFGRYNHLDKIPKKVFEPIKIGNITIPNRIVFPITTKYANDNGFVTQRIIDFHKHIAEGGAGLSVVGATPVRKDGKILANMQILDDDKYIEGLGQLFETIKQNGSIACIQLFHGGNRTPSSITGVQPVAPSPIPWRVGGEIPKELTIREIEDIVYSFAEAAYRAKLAGAKMVELHAAHGCLINGFLSPFSNKRNDEYGGNTENRTRFVKEIVEEIRKKVGNNFPICCRISAIEFIDGGLTIEESKDISQILVDSGIDVISVSVYGYGSKKFSEIPFKKQGRRCYAYIAREIKEAVDIPVIGVGNILDLNDAEIVLQDGDADMAAMGRALIADPYLISKTKQEKVEEINYCIQCRECIRTIRTPERMSCPVNKNL